MLSKMAVAILRRLSREFLETRLPCSNIPDLPLLVPWKRYIRHVKECRVRIMIRIYDGRYHCLRTTATPQSHHFDRQTSHAKRHRTTQSTELKLRQAN